MSKDSLIISRRNFIKMLGVTGVGITYLLYTGSPSLIKGAKAAGTVDSIYFTANELEGLKSLRTQPSHSAIWNNIVSYANSTVGTSPPSEPAQSVGKQAFSITNGAVKRHIETMAFMYCMTDDNAYADSAIDWMVSVSGWSKWGIPSSSWFNDSILMRGFAFAYSVVKDLMTAGERQIVIDSLAVRVNELYAHQKTWREAGIRDEGQAHYPYPNHEWGMAAAIGLVGLTLQGEHADAQTWYNFGLVATQDYLSEDRWGFGPDFGPDGDCFEGESYGVLTLLLVMPFLAALKTAGTNLFATSSYLANAAYYFIYMYLPKSQPGSQYEPKGWLAVEDSENHYCFNQLTSGGAPHPEGINFMYLLAKEFNNGHAQTFAKMGDDYTIYPFIWNDPGVLPLSFDSLPLSMYFSGAGYVLWKDGWGPNDLNVLFKSGGSKGHGHANQNEFMIWHNGDKITGSPGVGEDITSKHNCLLVYNSSSGQMEGQGQEWKGPANMKLGTRGVIEEVVETPYYRYARGDASAVYKPPDYTSGSPHNGILDKWLRHIVLTKNPSYIVVFDDVVAPQPTRIDFCMNSARFGGWNSSYAPPKRPLSISGNTISIGNELRTLVIEPYSSEHSITSYSGGSYHTFDIVQLRNPTNAAVQKFLTVHYLGTSILPTEAVKVGNCQGVIVTVGSNKDLVLFSTDGNTVNQYIELGGLYKSNDGGNYSFESTGVRVQFSVYQVLRLVPSNGQPVYNSSDVNSDGKVDVLDMIRVGQHQGETGTPGWIPEDINNDGIANVLDMINIGQNWTG